MLNQTGEFLIFDSNLKLALQPMLALSWKPNADGSVWTFKLRDGVTFHNGKQMTADDVVYTFKQLSDPKVASNALSTFTGVLTPAGVKKVDPTTVEFHLESPNGNFPYLVSSDNYNAIIVPDGTDFSQVAEDIRGDRRVQAGQLHAATGRDVRAKPQLLGDKTAAVRKPVQVLRRPAADDPGAAGRRRRRDRAVHPRRRDPAAEQLHLQDHQPQVRQSSRAVDAKRPGSVQRCEGPTGRRVLAGPDRDGRGAAQRQRQRCQRLSVRTAVPLHRHDGSAALAEHRHGQAAAAAGRTFEHQRDAVHRAVPGDPTARPSDPAERQAGGDQHQPEGRVADRTTTARRLSATPTGSTGR